MTTKDKTCPNTNSSGKRPFFRPAHETTSSYTRLRHTSPLPASEKQDAIVEIKSTGSAEDRGRPWGCRSGSRS